MEGAGTYFGKDLGTNNEAEATALAHAVAFAINNRGRLGAQVVRVIGDSSLLVSFMQRRARPSPKFAAIVKEVHQMCRAAAPLKVYFEFVPRERNQVADFLC